MDLQQLKNDNRYYKHHSAWCLGYVSRKIDETKPQLYKGRFGTGYVTYSPSWRSSRYCHINYYIQAQQ